MQTLVRSRLVVLVVMCIVLHTACAQRGVLPGDSPDRDVAQIAKTLDITAEGLAVFQKAVIASNQQTPKLIPDNTADTLVRFSLDMNLATKQAITATKAVAKLSPQDRRNIGAILTPILAAVDGTLKSPGLAGIQSEQLRLTLQTSLTSIQTTVTSVQMILEVRR